MIELVHIDVFRCHLLIDGMWVHTFYTGGVSDMLVFGDELFIIRCENWISKF